jgi:uncharacterized iron-regulated protein
MPIKMKFTFRWYAPALLALAALSGCASRPAQAPSAPISSAALPHPQVLLLGEVHDNPQAMRQRYEQLRQQVEAGWRPAIAMEQFDRENQDVLDKAQKGCLDAACVIRVAGGPGWDWQLYYPVLQLALTYQLPLVAVNLSRNDASRVVRDGVQATFDPKSVAAYHLDQALPAGLLSAQQLEIQAGHCNMLSDMMIGGMVNAQVARDIWMAKLVLEQVHAATPRDVVLIAGNGHVRKDIGVAYWLAQQEPALRLRSEAFLEADEPAGRYDVVHVAPAQPRADQCAQFKSKKS